nr:hypothetical protein GCM10020093_080620 [Planobispora longispora]
MHRGLRRGDDPAHQVGVVLDGADPGQSGHLVGDVQEPYDPAGRRGVQHHRVVDPPAVLALAADGLGGLARDEDVAEARGDGGGEVDDAQLAQGAAGPAHAVEHLEVFEHGLLGIEGQRVDVPAAGRDGDLPFLVRQRRQIEDLGDPLTPLDLDQQDLATFRGEREGECGGHRGLAGAALAGDDVEPYTIPVGIARTHVSKATQRLIDDSRWPPFGMRLTFRRSERRTSRPAGRDSHARPSHRHGTGGVRSLRCLA